jgi:hypothetical protein
MLSLVTTSRSALKAMHVPIQCGSGALSPAVTDWDFDLVTKNAWSCASILPQVIAVLCFINHRDKFSFTIIWDEYWCYFVQRKCCSFADALSSIVDYITWNGIRYEWRVWMDPEEPMSCIKLLSRHLTGETEISREMCSSRLPPWSLQPTQLLC